MRMGDSSVGGGQFHTTRWTLVMASADGSSQSVSFAPCDALVAAEGGPRPLQQNLEDLWKNPAKSWDQRGRKHVPVRSAARSSSPPAMARSVQFVSCGELPVGNLRRPGNRVQYVTQQAALGIQKVRRRFADSSIMK